MKKQEAWENSTHPFADQPLIQDAIGKPPPKNSRAGRRIAKATRQVVNLIGQCEQAADPIGVCRAGLVHLRLNNFLSDISPQTERDDPVVITSGALLSLTNAIEPIYEDLPIVPTPEGLEPEVPDRASTGDAIEEAAEVEPSREHDGSPQDEPTSPEWWEASRPPAVRCTGYNIDVTGYRFAWEQLWKATMPKGPDSRASLAAECLRLVNTVFHPYREQLSENDEGAILEIRFD